MEAIAQGRPLALLPLLGEAVLDYAFQGFAERGVSHLRIIACDQPEAIRRHVSHHSNWGLEIEVIAEIRELTREEAITKYGADDEREAWHLDPLPQAPQISLFSSPLAWHRARHALAPALLANAIGARELRPGVWIGWKASVHPTAVLEAPCWIGPGTRIGAHAQIGPHGFVEGACIVGENAHVTDSTICEGTYLGPLTRVHESVAAGSNLLNWRTSSCLTVPDPFLLGPVNPRVSSLGRGFLRRLGNLRVAAFSGLRAIVSRALPFAAGRGTSSIQPAPDAHHEPPKS